MRQLKITKSITNRESASLDKYLQEIGREDLLLSKKRWSSLSVFVKVTVWRWRN